MKVCLVFLATFIINFTHVKILCYHMSSELTVSVSDCLFFSISLSKYKSLIDF